MLLSTRPDWTRATKGAPIDTVVRVYAGNEGTRKDITSSRSTISIIRPGALQAQPDDEYEVGYVYGPEATNQDITARSLQPLVKKFVEGYNTTVICLGATGSGKTFTLEGGRARDAGRNSSEGDGIVHWAIDELFKHLHQRAVAVGDQVAQRRRMPTAKAFEFFLETSFVEVYMEGVRDLHQRGAAAQAKLPVYEDELEGYQVSGLSFRHAKSEAEMRAAFNGGRLMRDTGSTDLGSVHDRSAAIFTIYLAQYAPAAVPGEEDRVMVSKMQFVDMPGAERLAMEPELLRLREGVQLNRSLFAFAGALRELGEAGVAGGAPLAGAANVESSVLTRLLADALGGNSLVLMLGCCRQGSWELTRTCCQQLALARTSRTFPVVNHGRARGLILQLRRRLLALIAERDTLNDQMGELPADGDPNAVAISIAKVRDLEFRLLAEREEKATLLEEKQALQARLMKLREAGTGDLAEKADLQEALIKSEELRLQLAKTLISTQMDFNDQQVGWAEEKLDLEKRLADLEASHFERYVRAEDHAALEQERDALNSRLLGLQDEISRKDDHIQELKDEVEEVKTKLRKAEQDLNLIGGDGPHHDFDDSDTDEVEVDSVEGKRRKLVKLLKTRNRRIEELMVEMREVTGELDRLRNMRQLTQTGVDEMREAYRRKLEVQMRDVTDLARAVAIMEEDPSTGLRVRPEDLFNTLQKLTDENLRVTEARERDMRCDLDMLQTRHVDLKTKFKSLYIAYRQARYLVEDKWPPASAPLELPTEDQVVHAACESISRSEDDADRRLIARLRDQASQLGTQLSALKMADAAAAKGVTLKPSNLAMASRDNGFDGNRFAEMPDMMSLENETMRSELDRLRQQMLGTPVESIKHENKLLHAQVHELSSDKSRAAMAKELATTKLEVDRLRQQLAGGIAGPYSVTDAKSVTQQIQEFQATAQAELERKLQSAEAAKLMAEEQLTSLQKYLTQATVQYQREIVRLRGIIGQMDPGGRLAKADPLRGK